ncbi:MAG: hypothetical protein AAGA29_10515 [Planctomycetota bacterium]
MYGDPPPDPPDDPTPPDDADADGGKPEVVAFNFEALIHEPGEVPEDPKSEKIAEELGAMTQQNYDARRRQQMLDAYKQDFELRKEYTPQIFKLVRVWLIFVAVFLVASSLPGLSFRVCGVPIRLSIKTSDVVLVALLGQATATVVGLFVVVARWIYPKRDQGGS